MNKPKSLTIKEAKQTNKTRQTTAERIAEDNAWLSDLKRRQEERRLQVYEKWGPKWSGPTAP